MITFEMQKFIKKNIDLDPEELQVLVKNNFSQQCDETEINCLCNSIKTLIGFYEGQIDMEQSDTRVENILKALHKNCR